MQLLIRLLILVFSLVIVASDAQATPAYTNKLPSDKVASSCKACHTETIPNLNQWGKNWVVAGKDHTKMSTLQKVMLPSTNATISPAALTTSPKLLLAKEFTAMLQKEGYPVVADSPDIQLPRWQAALLAVRALGLATEQADLTVLQNFQDLKDIPMAARFEIAAAVKHGLFVGLASNQFGAKNILTDVQAGVVVKRVDALALNRAISINRFQGAEGYVGPEACKACHNEIYNTWKTSWHAKKSEKGPSFGEHYRKDKIYPWVKDKWNELDAYMIVDTAGSNAIYLSTTKVEYDNIDFVIGGQIYQRYAVYYDGGPLTVWKAYTKDNGISWQLDKTTSYDYSGNKDRTGYKFLFLQLFSDGRVAPENYGEWASWQERCVSCHTTGFDDQAWDKAKADFKAGNRTDLRELFVADLRISCERCHGPAKAHINTPNKNNIINPAKLTDPEERLMVCGQCHTRTGVGTKNPIANDLRGFRIGGKYTDFVSFIAPAWGDGNRSVSPDGKGRRLRQQDMDIRLSSFIRPWSVHGTMTCFDCHNAHANPKLKKTREETCNQCHQGTMDPKKVFDGNRGWERASFGKWNTFSGRRGAGMEQHIFNLDSQGRAFGLTPDKYTWVLRTGTNIDPTLKQSWQSIWPWEKADYDLKGRTTFTGAEPWKKQ